MFSELLIAVKLYPVNERLEAGPDFLKLLSPGEGVITINWFGRPISAALRKGLEGRKDIYWLEDRAQCLSGPKSKARAVIYCPHKVLGVPDGGVLVGKGAKSLQAVEKGQAAIEKMTAFMLNYESGGKNFLAEREAEKKIQLPKGSASLTTLNILKKISYRKVCEANRANWRYLYNELGAYALWKIPKPNFVPTFFPMLIPSSFLLSVFVGELARKGIEATSLFPTTTECYAQDLAQKLVILPLGHHLSTEHLAYMVRTIKRLLGNEHNDMLKSQRSSS